MIFLHLFAWILQTGDVIETVLSLVEVAGLIAGREADGSALGYLVKVGAAILIAGQRLTGDSEDNLVEFIPGLRTVVRHEVQQDGADRLVLAHVLKILRVNNNCY